MGIMSVPWCSRKDFSLGPRSFRFGKTHLALGVVKSTLKRPHLLAIQSMALKQPNESLLPAKEGSNRF